MTVTTEQQEIYDYMQQAHSKGANIIEIILAMRVTSFFPKAISVSKIEWLQTVKKFSESVLMSKDYRFSKNQQIIVDYMKDEYSAEYVDIMELIWRMEIKPIFNIVSSLTNQEKIQCIYSIAGWALEQENAWARV